jgi:hypothetical protein
MSVPALPQREFSIADKQYRITALPFVEGRKALIRLQRCLGPAFAAFLEGQAKARVDTHGRLPQPDLTDVSIEAHMQRADLAQVVGAIAGAGAIRSLATQLTEDDFEWAWNLFQARTEGWGGEGFVPLAKVSGYAGFACDYGSMLKLMQEHLDFNFSSFFSVLQNTSLQG